MNAHTQHAIHSFYKMFYERSFDQDDVYKFFVAARDYAPKNSTLREVGDFLAHPEEKDRGLILTSVSKIMPVFETLLRERDRDVWSDPTKWPKFDGIGTDEQLLSDVASVFRLAGLTTPPVSRKSLSSRDLQFCTIFMLGTYRIRYLDRVYPLQVIYGHSLELIVNCESQVFSRNFARLPVLQLQNVWVHWNYGKEFNLDGFIARRSTDGFLGAMCYAQDPGHRRFDATKFQRGELWCLPDDDSSQ